LTANGVSATITTSDPYVYWPYNTFNSYGDIASGAVVINSDDFDFELAADTPDGHLIHFNLNITATNGGRGRKASMCRSPAVRKLR